MAISQQFLDELVARTDIVELVGQYVQLTRKGANYFGLCPFHNEKTGSFSVNSERQIYHCFGCGAGGGAIRFIMEIEGLPFPDAVALLAQRAGMEMEEEQRGDLGARRRRDRILELNKKAARFFYQQFLSEAGAGARAYAARRGLSSDTIKRFGIGFAPDQWDALLRRLKSDGASDEELLDAGLVVRGKKGGIYDRFRNRLMFPIINIRGEVVAFGGRVLGDGEPKYLNSPDTPVFNKSRNLFALNIAKTSKTGRLILTEGNMDAISLHQAGFDNAIASCGTALTEEQAKLISRFANEVIIAYDSDAAGRKAVLRAITILEKTGLTVRVLNYSGAKDPDEYIQKNGPEAFALLIDDSGNHITYRLDTIRRKYDLEDDSQRVAYLREAAELLSRLKPIEREIYGAKTAENARVTPGAMQAAIKDAYTRRRKRESAKELREETAPLQRFQPKQRDLRYEDPVSARAEEEILRLVVEDETLLPLTESILRPEDFSSSFLGKVYAAFSRQRKEGRVLSPGALEGELTEEEMARLSQILQRPGGTISGGEAQIRACAEIISTQHTMKQAKDDDDALLALQKKLAGKKGTDGSAGRN